MFIYVMYYLNYFLNKTLEEKKQKNLLIINQQNQVAKK